MGMSPNKIDRVVARLTISRIADIFHQEVQGIPFTSAGHYRMREAAEKLILDLIPAYKRGQNSLGDDEQVEALEADVLAFFDQHPRWQSDAVREYMGKKDPREMVSFYQ